MPNATSTVDRDALNLTRAIALAESGGGGKPNYNAQGDKGSSKGAYQWQPGNFERQAQEAGLNPSDFSPENQDKVAYAWVKKKKDEGYQPWEIAAMHNSGSPENWKNHKGRNEKLGVDYDTPAYVAKVKNEYLKMSGEQPEAALTPTPEQSPAPTPMSPQESARFLPLGTRMGTDAAPTPEQGKDSLRGNLMGATSFLQGANTLDTMNKMAGNPTLSQRFGVDINQATAPTTPEQEAGSIGSKLLGEVATMANPVSALNTASKARSAVGLLNKTTQAVAPRLTEKTAVEATKTAPQGFKGLISTVPDKRTKEVADIAQSIFNPKKTFSENAKNVKSAIATKAQELSTTLKTRAIPFIFRELQSDFQKLELPHFIKTSDKVVQKRAQSIINKFMEIAKKHEGKLDGLLDARKEFDNWVEREYPRVFDESGNAVNQLVRNIRQKANDFIEKRAPDVGVKKSLKEQNLLYDALDTFNEKAVMGAPKKMGEIGSTRLSRWAEAHPKTTGLLGKGAGYAAAGLGIGAAGGGAYGLLGGK